jgi:multiple sugar transport system ATP-binding protein
VGSPSEVYQHPINLFVAQFVGSPVMNICGVRLQTADGKARVAIGSTNEGFEFPADLPQRIAASDKAAGELTLGVRPEGVMIARQATPGYVSAEAHFIEPLGAYDIVDLRIGGQLMRARTASNYVGKAGTTVWAKLDEAQTHFFSTRTGDSLQIRLGQ